MKEFVEELYSDVPSIPTIRTVQVGDFVYADEINQIEDNFKRIAQFTFNRNYGSCPVYHDNDSFIDFRELNRLESAILDMYDRLTNQYNGRRTFTWAFGTKGGEL